ncbi:MAG: alpha/beta fold hydrolase [Pirellulales bacterium]|nr:alpha/beta fold hydrolase [Pirellulales bacterium]
MQKNTINGIEIAFVDRGAGPVLLLVHGFPLDHSMWDAQIYIFQEKYRVIAVDLRGFGQSQVVEGTTDMETMADDLNDLLDSLKIDDPVVVVGLSMGGYVAFQFALKYPQKLSALILCDTRALADTSEVADGRLQAAKEVIADGPKSLVDSMMPRLFAEATVSQNPAMVDSLRDVMMTTDRQTIAAAARGMARRPDVRPWLGKIECPTLVIVGEHDVISPVDEMRAIADGIPHSSFVEIDGSGHMSPMEKPEDFNSAVLKFLATVFFCD